MSKTNDMHRSSRDSVDSIVAFIHVAHLMAVMKIDAERGETVYGTIEELDRLLARAKSMQAENLASLRAA
jgi:hypothetical protein